MRVLLVALLLLPVAATAQAHIGHGGDHRLELQSLVIRFNPINATQDFSFHLWNNHTSSTGAIFARITLVDETTPVQARASSQGLAPNQHGNFTASVPARVSVRGCVVADGTGAHTTSNQECGQTSGLTIFPFDLPFNIPPVTELDDHLPENIPTPDLP